MRVSYQWLKELVDIDLKVDDLAQRLTMLGLEIESIDRPGEGIREVYIGRILDIKPHPDADKLVVCQTDVGRAEPLQIVCGAANMRSGDLVPTALAGATLPGDFTIGRRKVRGVESQGMMCSPQELGLGQDHSGLLILSPDMSPDMPVGADAVPILGLDDVILEIEVTPNRGDWAGMIGVARELSAALGAELRLPSTDVVETGPPVTESASVTIEDPELCPRYTGRVLSHVKIGPSPLWMVRRLIHAGQRPISNIVDITNYVLLETGHPLHAFDYDKLLGHKIIVRCAKHGETVVSIDEQTRTLSQQNLVIADREAPVAIAGVMGGYKSEVGDGTSVIFLESAYFQPQSIRRTSRALGLQTESSTRFQRGADPEMAPFALDRAARLIVKLAGATAHRGILDEYPGRKELPEIELRYERTNVLLGSEVPVESQRKTLRGLAFEVTETTQDACKVKVPSWRHDVTQEADLIEEVARLYGYDKIPVTVPRVRKTEQVYAPQEAPLRRLRNFLVGIGLTEMMNLSFGTPTDLHKARLEDLEESMVLLENPLSENHKGMRASLIPGMLNVVAMNIRRGVRTIRAFEVGNVYALAAEETLPNQFTRLCVVLTGQRGQAHWSGEETDVDFFDIKGMAESLTEATGIDLQIDTAEWGPLAPGHCAAISSQAQLLGHLGRVNAQVLQRFTIEQDVYLCDLELDRYLGSREKDKHFEPLSTFPPSLRDMAVVLDHTVPAAEVTAAVRKAGGNLLKGVSIFDVYTGKQVPEGKKSLALSLVFQADDRTLTDKDTQKSWDRILRSLEQQFEAKLR